MCHYFFRLLHLYCKSISKILEPKREMILKEKNEELYKIIKGLTPANIDVQSYRVPSWKTTKELQELSADLKALRTIMKKLSNRTFLSITPKVEDLKVVYTWICKYNVPHYYVQVFFDKAYGISFKKILTLISDPQLEGKDYFIESDIKNQNKATIKIQANKQTPILNKIELPTHHSELKELNRGRLLFYVKFDESVSVLDASSFSKLFGVEL